MENFIINFSLFLTLFWVVYLLFFRRETFFNHNRLYLLLTPIAAAILPFIFISELNFTTATSTDWQQITPLFLTGQTEAVGVSQEIQSADTSSLYLINWVLLGYGIGVLFMLFNFVRKLRKYTKLKTTARLEKSKQGDIYYLNQTKMAFTFLNSIFIGEDLNAKEQARILEHECVHKNQKHSVDLIYYEILKIIFWFHPAVYSLQNQVRLVHEYIADAAVAKNVSMKKYYENLLNSFFGVKQVSFTNQFFNHSLIKKRIMMLQKSKSKKTALLKYLMVLPLIMAMLTYVSCTKDDALSNTENEAIEDQEVMEIQETMEVIKFEVEDIENLNDTEIQDLTQKMKEATESDTTLKFIITDGVNKRSITLNDDNAALTPPAPPTPPTPTSEGVSYAVIDVVPAYPGCDQNADDAKNCTSNKIREFVGSHFDISLAEDLGLKGVNRVYVQFKIAKDGQIKDIKARSPYSELKDEAIRVVESLPQLQPGLQDGKKVSVTYALPITFNLD